MINPKGKYNDIQRWPIRSAAATILSASARIHWKFLKGCVDSRCAGVLSKVDQRCNERWQPGGISWRNRLRFSQAIDKKGKAKSARQDRRATRCDWNQRL